MKSGREVEERLEAVRRGGDAKYHEKAHAEGTTLKEAALALGLVKEEDFDKWINPEEMITPGM